MDDLQKQRVMVAIIVFNITIITYQIVFNSGFFNYPFSITKLLLGIVIAAAAGGVAYVATQFLQR